MDESQGRGPEIDVESIQMDMFHDSRRAAGFWWMIDDSFDSMDCQWAADSDPNSMDFDHNG